eukprot:1157999-Pelagomonas_calceolata.AAC.4
MSTMLVERRCGRRMDAFLVECPNDLPACSFAYPCQYRDALPACSYAYAAMHLECGMGTWRALCISCIVRWEPGGLLMGEGRMHFCYAYPCQYCDALPVLAAMHILECGMGPWRAVHGRRANASPPWKAMTAGCTLARTRMCSALAAVSMQR